MNPSRYTTLSQKIRDIFQNGWLLNKQTLDSIESTFGYPTASDLQAMLDSNDNDEYDILVELVLFPDEPVQVQIEPLLTEPMDPDIVFTILSRPLPNAIIRLPNANVLNLTVPHWALKHFISRLKLSKRLDPKICLTIENRFTNEHDIYLAKVKLRNSSIACSPNVIRFMARFFQRMPKENDTIRHLSSVLLMLEECNSIGIEWFLKQKVTAYRHQLEQALHMDKKIKSQNVEILLLQKAAIASTDINDINYKIKLLSKILHYVYACDIPPFPLLQDKTLYRL